MAIDTVRGAGAPIAATRLTGRRRALGSWGIVVAAGLVASALNLQVLRAGETRTPVVVVARALVSGDVVPPGALAVRDVSVESSLAASLAAPAALDHLVGGVAVVDLPAGAAVRPSDIRPAGTADDVRAMSIPVDTAHAVGGALRPGDRVDVIAVGEGEAAYVLRDAEVLAVADGSGQAGLAGPRGYSLTVAVDERSALAVAAAIRDGVDVVRAAGAP